jgi:hypothetical protein
MTNLVLLTLFTFFIFCSSQSSEILSTSLETLNFKRNETFSKQNISLTTNATFLGNGVFGVDSKRGQFLRSEFTSLGVNSKFVGYSLVDGKIFFKMDNGLPSQMRNPSLLFEDGFFYPFIVYPTPIVPGIILQQTVLYKFNISDTSVIIASILNITLDSSTKIISGASVMVNGSFYIAMKTANGSKILGFSKINFFPTSNFQNSTTESSLAINIAGTILSIQKMDLENIIVYTLSDIFYVNLLTRNQTKMVNYKQVFGDSKTMYQNSNSQLYNATTKQHYLLWSDELENVYFSTIDMENGTKLSSTVNQSKEFILSSLLTNSLFYCFGKSTLENAASIFSGN